MLNIGRVTKPMGKINGDTSLNSLNFFTVGKKFGLFCFIDEFENFNP